MTVIAAACAGEGFPRPVRWVTIPRVPGCECGVGSSPSGIRLQERQAMGSDMGWQLPGPWSPSPDLSECPGGRAET